MQLRHTKSTKSEQCLTEAVYLANYANKIVQKQKYQAKDNFLQHVEETIQRFDSNDSENIQSWSELFFLHFEKVHDQNIHDLVCSFGEVDTESGATSNLFEVSLNDENQKEIIVKYSKDDTSQIIREAFIGLMINQLRPLTPNFVYTLGFSKSEISISEKGKVIEFDHILSESNNRWFIPKCRTEKNSFLWMENIKNAQKLSEFIKTCQEVDFIKVLLQIMNSLNIAYQKLKFCHYDFHDENILIQTLDTPIRIHYSFEEIPMHFETQYLVKIIDFGQSFIKDQNQQTHGIFHYEKVHIFSHKAYPLSDIYKLICFSGYTVIDVNEKIFKLLSKMYTIFEEGFSLKKRIDLRIKYFNIYQGNLEFLDTDRDIKNCRTAKNYSDDFNFGQYHFPKRNMKKRFFTEKNHPHVLENYHHKYFIQFIHENIIGNMDIFL